MSEAEKPEQTKPPEQFIPVRESFPAINKVPVQGEHVILENETIIGRHTEVPIIKAYDGPKPTPPDSGKNNG